MGRTKKEIVVETIKCNLCSKELKGDDLVYHYRLQTFCGECFKGVLKTKGKINELQQRIDKAIEYIENNTYDDSLDGDGSRLMFEKANGKDLLEILKGDNDE